MNPIQPPSTNPPEAINRPRRRFLGSAALTLAATQLGMLTGLADAQPAAQSSTARTVPAITPGTDTSFAPSSKLTPAF